MPPEDTHRTWAREDLVRAPAVVTRVGKTFVSVELPPPLGRHTLPWRGPQLRVGDRVTVAGEPAGGFYRRFRPLVVGVAESGGLMRWLGRGSFTLVTIPQSDRERQVSTPTTPQPWLEVLERHGLLEAAGDVRPDLYGADATGVLVCTHAPRGALSRGFVHYDAAWGNDTDDLVADLAAIAGHPESFSRVAVDRSTLRFMFRRRDGSAVEAVVDVEDGDVDPVAARMNGCLDELDAKRRIWTLDTGQETPATRSGRRTQLRPARLTSRCS
jgi:hypothetical protein